MTFFSHNIALVARLDEREILETSRFSSRGMLTDVTCFWESVASTANVKGLFSREKTSRLSKLQKCRFQKKSEIMIEDNIITKEYYNEFLKADLVTIYL